MGPGGITVAAAQQPPIPPWQPVIPEEAVIITLAFFAMIAFIAIGWPIARAFARRLDRQNAPPRVAGETAESLRRIETSVEAMSIEVERISENQRYVTKLLAGRQPAAGLPAARES